MFIDPKKIFIILSLVTSFSGTTQVNLDSLWGVWNNTTQPDTNRLNAMYKICKEGYLFTQPDTALYFAQLQYDFAKEKGEKKYMADALNLQGISCTITGDYPKALDYYTHCMEIKEELGDKQGVSVALANMGGIYMNQGDYPKALDYHTRGLQIKEELKDTLGVSKSLSNIGLIYLFQGDYVEAIDYQTRSLKIKEELGDRAGASKSLNSIGLIYYKQGDYANAINYYTRSLKIKEELGDQLGVSGSLNNIGLIYHDLGEYIKAIDYYTRSLEIKEEIGDKRGILSSLNNLGMSYSEQGDHAMAIDYYTQGLKVSEELGEKRGVARILNNLGVIYREQGDYDMAIDYCTQGLKISEEAGDKDGIALSLTNIGNSYYLRGNYSKAKESGEKALAIAQEINVTETIKIVSDLLWKVNKKLERYKSALEMHELYISARDSIQSEENQKEVIRQEYKYAYEKQAAADSIKTAESNKVKDAQIAAEKAKTKQQRQQKYFLYAGLAITLLFGGIILNRFRVTSKQKLRNLELEKQISVDKLESATQNIREKLEIIEKLESKLETKSVESEKYRMERISVLFTENNYLNESKWNEVIYHYDNVHNNFTKHVMQRFDKITKEDIKLLILIKMGFLNKEISAVRGTTIDATKKAKQRLRAKTGTRDLANI